MYLDTAVPVMVEKLYLTFHAWKTARRQIVGRRIAAMVKTDIILEFEHSATPYLWVPLGFRVSWPVPRGSREREALPREFEA